MKLLVANRFANGFILHHIVHAKFIVKRFIYQHLFAMYAIHFHQIYHQKADIRQ